MSNNTTFLNKNETSLHKEYNADVSIKQENEQNQKCKTQIPNQKLKNELNNQILHTQFDRRNILHEPSSDIICEYQEENQQTQNIDIIDFKMLKLCKSCNQYIEVRNFNNHYYECKDIKMKQRLIQNVDDRITISHNIEQNSNQISDNSTASNVAEDESGPEIISGYTDKGTYKRMEITKDKKTGFTHTKTTYPEKQNNISNEKTRKNNEINPQQIKPQNEYESALLCLDSSSTPFSDGEDVCPICNKQYNSLEKTIFSACEHKFHRACVKNNNCPICPQGKLQ